jgi:anti-sigma regulatory factor (Ser/Thr protein kinase)
MTDGEDLIKLDDLEFLADGADDVGRRENMSLIAFTLPSTPHSVQVARFCIQAALRYHQLGGYAEDALTVTSELVTNVIKHANSIKLGVEVMRLAGCEAVAIIVTDSSRCPPVKRYPAANTEHGRGLHIVDVLSASWGWQPQGPGKAVHAILTMADGHATHTAAKDVLEQVEARKENPMTSKTDVTASARLLCRPPCQPELTYATYPRPRLRSEAGIWPLVSPRLE